MGVIPTVNPEEREKGGIEPKKPRKIGYENIPAKGAGADEKRRGR